MKIRYSYIVITIIFFLLLSWQKLNAQVVIIIEDIGFVSTTDSMIPNQTIAYESFPERITPPFKSVPEKQLYINIKNYFREG